MGRAACVLGILGIAWGIATGAVRAGGPGPRLAGIPRDWVEHRVPHPRPSAAYGWVDEILEVTGREVERLGTPRPTVISRQMVIPLLAMYEAWAAHDARALGLLSGDRFRRPPEGRGRTAKETAIAYAVHRTLLDLFPEDRAWLEARMRARGLDPDDESLDLATPRGLGNRVAALVLEARRRDGANQAGDEPGSRGGPYSDYTGYEPRNPVDRIVDPDRWQPIPFADGKGGKRYPGFLTPHWGLVKPLLLARSDAFRPPPVPRYGSPALARDIAECIRMNGDLSLEQKAVVEFMRDGPRSTGQSGHWLQFAQDVSRRDAYGLDQDVKLFFAIGLTAFDTFIAAWEAKRHYDSSRPWTLIRHAHPGESLVGWRGPGQGSGTIPSDRWHPYSPDTFPTPPFPGYPSGHSTVSGGCARMLQHVTGSDRFGSFVRHAAGSWTEPGHPVAAMQACEGRRARGLPRDPRVVLRMPTFTATAEMAGISRVLGGYHIQADNTEGLALGRAVADDAWPKLRALFGGRALPAR